MDDRSDSEVASFLRHASDYVILGHSSDSDTGILRSVVVDDEVVWAKTDVFHENYNLLAFDMDGNKYMFYDEEKDDRSVDWNIGTHTNNKVSYKSVSEVPLNF